MLYFLENFRSDAVVKKGLWTLQSGYWQQTRFVSSVAEVQKLHNFSKLLYFFFSSFSHDVIHASSRKFYLV